MYSPYSQTVIHSTLNISNIRDVLKNINCINIPCLLDIWIDIPQAQIWT